MVKNLPANAGDVRPEFDLWVRKILWKSVWQSTPVWSSSMGDPEKYIRAFKGVIMFYDLTWKDVMHILVQMLTPNSKTRVLEKAVAYTYSLEGKL